MIAILSFIITNSACQIDLCCWHNMYVFAYLYLECAKLYCSLSIIPPSVYTPLMVWHENSMHIVHCHQYQWFCYSLTDCFVDSWTACWEHRVRSTVYNHVGWITHRVYHLPFTPQAQLQCSGYVVIYLNIADYSTVEFDVQT